MFSSAVSWTRRQAPARRRLSFYAVAVLVLVLSLAPAGPELPTTGWDKANHLLAFSVLAVLGCWAHAGRIPAVLAALVVYGAVIELLQALTPYRFAQWGDLLADALGVALGAAIAWMLARIGTAPDTR